MIIFMLERLCRARRIGQIILATSDDISDDPLAETVRGYGITCIRGNLHDVLDRFRCAARQLDADVVVRLTGDCPLVDPSTVDRVVSALIGNGSDYASNIAPPTFPDGLDVEAFNRSALEAAWAEATLPSDREHVTPYIRSRPGRFAMTNVEAEKDFSALRWTVDYPEDLLVIQKLVDGIGDGARDASFADFIQAWEKQPELARLNQHDRNIGYAKSLEQDRSSLA